MIEYEKVGMEYRVYFGDSEDSPTLVVNAVDNGEEVNLKEVVKNYLQTDDFELKEKK